MLDALGLGDVSAQATQPNPDRRLVTAGHAVNAMVLNGRGCVNQPRSLGPRCFQDTPTARRWTPAWIEAKPRPDEALGGAVDTLDDDGVTARDRLRAATAAERRGLAPTVAQRERPRCQVEGRDHHDEPPDAQVVPITRGDRREHRPALTHVRLALRVEPHAGMPVRLPPLRGNSRDAKGCGQGVRAPLEPLHTTDGTTSVVAERALSRAEHLPPLAHTPLQWRTRGPAPWREAPSVLAPAAPQARRPRPQGDRSHGLTATDGGMAQRWGRIDSASRPPPAKRPVAPPLRQHRAPAVTAGQHLCAKALACEAAARQALATFAPGWQATGLPASTIGPTRREGTRGRPGHGAPPDHGVDPLIGALASRVAAQQARVDQQRCVIRAPSARDNTPLPPQARCAGDTGQVDAERGVRFLKAPCCRASARARKPPERLMALCLVMTVCVLVSAAWVYRIRHARQDPGATFPHQTPHPVQNPTARGVFHDCGGMHLRLIPHHWPIVIHLTEAHQHLLPRLGNRYAGFYR